MIAFVVHGDPVGKGRPRITRTGHAYTPAKTAEAENRVRVAAREAMNGKIILDEPVAVTVEAEYLIPRSWPLKKQRAALEGEVRPGWPDLDNVVKLALDAINGIVITDDARVTNIRAMKRYGAEPKIRITIAPDVAPAKARAHMAGQGTPLLTGAAG